jgi:hypothetical protein
MKEREKEANNEPSTNNERTNGEWWRHVPKDRSVQAGLVYCAWRAPYLWPCCSRLFSIQIGYARYTYATLVTACTIALSSGDSPRPRARASASAQIVHLLHINIRF